jgi:hypothetical protein
MRDFFQILRQRIILIPERVTKCFIRKHSCSYSKIILIKNCQFLKIRCIRIWKNLSWPYGRSVEVGLLAEISLRLGHHNCIFDFPIGDSHAEKWVFLCSSFYPGFREWKHQFFADHYQYQTLKLSWAISDNPINFFWT